MNNYRGCPPCCKMRKFIVEQSEDEFYPSHPGLALAGLGVNRFTKLDSKLKKVLPETKDIAAIDIIRSYIGILVLGKRDYEAITEMKNDRFFSGIARDKKKIPPPETLGRTI